MEKAWLKSYPAGVPAEIDVNEFKSIGQLFDRSVRSFRDRIAYTNMGKSITYGELDGHTRDFAAYLQSLGLPKGARVAVMMPNLLQDPVAMFGTLRAGFTVVNVNPLYTPRELEHQLQDSGAKAIVILESFAHALQQVLHHTQVQHVITMQPGDLLPAPRRWLVNLVVKWVKRMVPPWRIDGAIDLRTALARGAAMTLAPVEVTREDIAFLQYTGGTTGIAKGAMLTHRNILANIEQDAACGSRAASRRAPRSSSHRCPCTTSSVSPRRCRS